VQNRVSCDHGRDIMSSAETYKTSEINKEIKE